MKICNRSVARAARPQAFKRISAAVTNALDDLFGPAEERPRVSRSGPGIHTIERLEERRLLSYTLSSALTAYNTAATDLATASQAATVVNQAFGTNVNIPLLGQTLSSALGLGGDFATPFQNVLNVNAPNWTSVLNSLPAGFSAPVQFTATPPTTGPNAYVLFEIEYSQTIASPAVFETSGSTGFGYLNGGELFGALTASAPTVTLTINMGVDAVNNASTPSFFIASGTGSTGSSISVANLTATGSLGGSVTIGDDDLGNVSVTGSATVALTQGSLSFVDQHNDGMNRVRVSDITNISTGSVAANVAGTVTLGSTLTASLPFLSNFSWSPSFGGSFANSTWTTTSINLNPPSATSILSSLGQGFLSLGSDFISGGGASAVLGPLSFLNKQLPLIDESVAQLTGLDGDIPSFPSLGNLSPSNVISALYDYGFKIDDQPVASDVTFAVLQTIATDLINGTHIDLISWSTSGSIPLVDFNYKVPIYSFGIPDIASVDIDATFGVGASLFYNIGFGLDTHGFYMDTGPLLGVTFGADAGLEGDVEVFGFDVASAGGDVGFSITPSVELTGPKWDPAGRVYASDLALFGSNPVTDFVDALGVELKADFTGDLYAKVDLLFWSISWNWSIDVPVFNIHDDPQWPAENPNAAGVNGTPPAPWSQATMNGTTLTFNDASSTANDILKISEGTGGSVTLDWLSGGGTESGTETFQNVGQFDFIGSEGDDELLAGSSFDLPIKASSNDQKNGSTGTLLQGGSAGNTLTGGAGNDTLIGGSGNDSIQGGSGNTYIIGNDGNDTLIAGSGPTQIVGGSGNSSLIGGSANDTLDAGGGNDTIWGGSGEFNINGGRGNDIIYGYGQAGPSSVTAYEAGITPAIDAGSGHTVIYGGATPTAINGDSGSDTIYGGSGRDTIYAGAGGNSYIQGAPLTAGSAYINAVPWTQQSTAINFNSSNISGLNTTYLLAGDAVSGAGIEPGTTIASVSAGQITLSLPAIASASSVALTFGGNQIFGGGSGDTLVGGAGNNVLTAGPGNETLYGGLGSDASINNLGNGVNYTTGEPLSTGTSLIAGSTGADLMFGDSTGHNTLEGGSGNDTIYAGPAGDYLAAGSGLDAIYGGPGDDSIQANFYTPQIPIQTATESGTTVTLAVSGNYPVGQIQNAGGATSSGSTGTFAYSVGQLVTIAGVTPSAYDGNFVITAVGNGTISYVDAAGLGAASVNGGTLALSDTLEGGAGLNTLILEPEVGPQVPGPGTLVGSINASTGTITVTNGNAAYVGELIQIDNEQMKVVSATSTVATGTLVAGTRSTITAESLTSNVATLTAANNFITGQTVIVSGAGDGFDGTFTVQSETPTTFSYSLAAANIASQSMSGLVTSEAVVTGLSTTSNITVGDQVSAINSGIPLGAVVTSVSGNTVALNCNATVTGNTQLTFSGTLQVTRAYNSSAGTHTAGTIVQAVPSLQSTATSPAYYIYFTQTANNQYQATLSNLNTNGSPGSVLGQTNLSLTTDLQQIAIEGGLGNNVIKVDPSVTRNMYLYGGPGNNTLYAGSGNDTLVAGTGTAVEYGGSGDDLLYGGDQPPQDEQPIFLGQTAQTGTSGHDTLIAGSGNSELFAGSGGDLLIGGGATFNTTSGQWTLIPTAGRDVLTGGSGNDLLIAGPTSPGAVLNAGSGNDTLVGGPGQDIMKAGSGSDLLLGGNLLNLMTATTGNVTMVGGTGLDFETGGTGNNVLYATYQQIYWQEAANSAATLYNLQLPVQTPDSAANPYQQWTALQTQANALQPSYGPLASISSNPTMSGTVAPGTNVIQYAPINTSTGTIAAGGDTIQNMTLNASTTLQAGEWVTGIGIPAGTIISFVYATHEVILSNDATLSGTYTYSFSRQLTVGETITGANIPGGSTVAAILSPTSIELSNFIYSPSGNSSSFVVNFTVGLTVQQTAQETALANQLNEISTQQQLDTRVGTGGSNYLVTLLEGGNGNTSGSTVTNQIYGNPNAAIWMIGGSASAGTGPVYNTYYNYIPSDTIAGSGGTHDEVLFSVDGYATVTQDPSYPTDVDITFQSQPTLAATTYPVETPGSNISGVTVLGIQTTGTSQIQLAASTTAGSPTITGLTGTSALYVGEGITGSGIPMNAVIGTISSNQITLVNAFNASSQALATATATEAVLSFAADTVSIGSISNTSTIKLSIQAGSGNDLISAPTFTTGATINGGSGNDIIQIAANAATGTVITGGTGQSELDLIGSTSFNLSAGSLLTNGTPIAFTPNGFSKIVAVGASGNDTFYTDGSSFQGTHIVLEGGSGTDVFDAIGGITTLIGGNGANIFNLTGAGTYSVVGNPIASSNALNIAWTDPSNDSITLSQPSGSASASIILSGVIANSILIGTASGITGVSVQGGSGNNTINASGMAMGVSLQGGGGVDTLTGGSGNDIFIFNNPQQAGSYGSYNGGGGVANVIENNSSLNHSYFVQSATNVEVYDRNGIPAPFSSDTVTIGGMSAAPVSGTQSTLLTIPFTASNPSASSEVVTVNWGDGYSSTATVNGSGGTYTASASHLYSIDATYTISVSVVDIAGAAGTATLSYTGGLTLSSGILVEHSDLPSNLNVLNSFTGAGPAPSGISLDSSGNAFGTTELGGPENDGIVFEIAKGTSAISTLATFTGLNGESPNGVVTDSSGDLFGTTEQGGASGDGTVFEIVHGSGTIITLVSFNGGNGVSPGAGLTLDSSGDLFGTTRSGGTSNDGTVFEIVHGTTAITTLANFNGTNGENPQDSLTLDSAGDIFGTTVNGGASNWGTVFEIAHGTQTITDLFASFTLATGINPYGNLAIDSSGDLFGTTNEGGTSGSGTVFEIPAGTLNSITDLASFGNGGGPLSGLTTDSSGNLYGTTYGGVGTNDGTVYEVEHGSDIIQTLINFNGSNGQYPQAGVTFDSNGDLFGTTNYGGSGSFGVIFEILPYKTIDTGVAAYLTRNSDSQVFALHTNGILYADGGASPTAIAGGVTAIALAPDNNLYVLQNGYLYSIANNSTSLSNFDSLGTSSLLTMSNGSVVKLDTGGLLYYMPTGTTSWQGPANKDVKSIALSYDGGAINVLETDGDYSRFDGVNWTLLAEPHFALSVSTSAIAGAATVFTLTAIDPLGNVVTGYTGTVTFSSTDTAAGLPSSYTFTSADAGSRTFSVTFETVVPASAGSTTLGMQSLSVTDNESPVVVTASAAVTVNPATAVAFTVSPSVTSSVAGTQLSVQVTAVDAYGNTVNNYSGTINISNGSTVLVSGYQFTTGTTSSDNGSHTFPITLDVEGAQVLTATDIHTSGLNGTGSVMVTPAAFNASTSTLTVSPGGVAPNGTATILLTARDQYGNVETSGGLSVLFQANGDGQVVQIANPAVPGGLLNFLDNGNGTYTGLVQASSTPGAGTISVSAQANGQNISSMNLYVEGISTLSGSSSYYLRLDADKQHVDIWDNSTGTGTVSQELILDQISSLSITASAGAGSLTIDDSAGNILPPLGINFVGNSSDQLKIIGTGGTDTVTASTGEVLFDNIPITYSGISQVIFNPNGGDDSLSISSSQLTVAAPPVGGGILERQFSSISIGSGATLLVASPVSHSDRAFLVVASLSIAGTTNAWTGTLNLGGNDLDVLGGNLLTLTNQLAEGYNNGVWTGQGIDSLAAATDPTHLTALGVIVNNNGNSTPQYGSGSSIGMFDGFSPAAADVLVKYTYYGDSNLDGRVDGSDYSKIDNGYLTYAAGWYNGDFNYDGVIDGSDYTLIDNAFNTQGASLVASTAAQVPVPEMASSARSSAPQQAVTNSISVPSASAADAKQKARSPLPSTLDIARKNPLVFNSTVPISMPMIDLSPDSIVERRSKHRVADLLSDAPLGLME